MRRREKLCQAEGVKEKRVDENMSRRITGTEPEVEPEPTVGNALSREDFTIEIQDQGITTSKFEK
jgi:hypothetical protein